MPRYDKERLLEDADGYTVAAYIGMDIIHRGAHDWILCPGHEKRLGKKDTRMSNCYLTKRGYKCFACGVTQNVFDMVMEYYESELGKKITFTESMGIVGDALGGRTLYQLDNNVQEPVIRKHWNLSFSDYKLIGLSPYMEFEQFINCGTDIREAEEEGVCYKKQIDYEDTGLFIYFKREKVNMNVIAEEYPDEYKKIVISQALKKKEEYEKLLDRYEGYHSDIISFLRRIAKKQDMDDEFLYDLKQCIRRRINRIKEILIEIAPEILENERPKEDYFSMFG